MLSDAYYFTDQEDLAPYKLTHANHPCSIWARETLSNWIWLRTFAIELCKEYTHRYDRHHACEYYLWYMPFPKISKLGLTPFAQAMPIQYKNKDVVMAYRNYYNGDKRHLFKWKNREVPEWIL